MKSLDLICKRYPGTKPSEYLKLEGYEALRFDLSCAYLGEYSDYDREYAMLDEVLSGFVMLARCQGSKKARVPSRKKLVGSLIEKEPTTSEVISQLMTTGTVME